MQYRGIELSPPTERVHMTHSVVADAILQKDSTENMDWTEKLGSVPWGDIKEYFPDSFEEASRICSLLNMNYECCNGGISQYFDNGYHEKRSPYTTHDVARVDFKEQMDFFKEIVKFARAIFPERLADNTRLNDAFKAFQELEYRPRESYTDMVYSDEPEFIEDPDNPGEEIKNPDYEDPYEDTFFEDVIIGEKAFESCFYVASNYLEEVLELRSQFAYLSLEKEMEEEKEHLPEVAAALEKMHGTHNASFDQLVEAAMEKTQNFSEKSKENPEILK